HIDLKGQQMEQDTADGVITTDTWRDGWQAVSGCAYSRSIRARRDLRELLGLCNAQRSPRCADPCHGIPEIVIGDQGGPDQRLQLLIFEDLKPLQVPKRRRVGRCGWISGAAEDRRGGERWPLIVWTDLTAAQHAYHRHDYQQLRL